MALALVEKYSRLSVKDCLRPQEKAEKERLAGNLLVDLPLFDSSVRRSFAVPPGIEVGIIWIQRFPYCSVSSPLWYSFYSLQSF